MIDVAVTEDGTFLVVHDLEDLFTVASLHLDSVTFSVTAKAASGGIKTIGTLQPSLVRDALSCSQGRCIALDGMDTIADYSCPFIVDPQSESLRD